MMKFFRTRTKKHDDTAHRKIEPVVVQEMVIDFVKDKQTVEKAARGSMDKRIELMRQAELHKHPV